MIPDTVINNLIKSLSVVDDCPASSVMKPGSLVAAIFLSCKSSRSFGSVNYYKGYVICLHKLTDPPGYSVFVLHGTAEDLSIKSRLAQYREMNKLDTAIKYMVSLTNKKIRKQENPYSIYKTHTTDPSILMNYENLLGLTPAEASQSEIIEVDADLLARFSNLEL